MRRDLLEPPSDPALAAVDRDLQHLLASWFNRGFLVLRRIDWQTPAAILEKIIAYEAVHEIQGWDDLRRRLDPADRRCFAFFHPSLIDEPLIFVEVALTRDMPDAIQSLLRGAARTAMPRQAADDGRVLLDLQLPGGAARHLVRQLPDQAGGRGAGEGAPSLKTFVTLSPVPHFADWLERAAADATARARRRRARAPCSTRAAQRLGRRCTATPSRRAVEPAAAAACRALLPQRQEPRTAARSIPWPASTSATARGSSASTGWRIPRQKACARRTD